MSILVFLDSPPFQTATVSTVNKKMALHLLEGKKIKGAGKVVMIV